MKGRAEKRIVRTRDIVEFPTALGSRCALLRELGLDAYTDTEEELLEALTGSAGRPEFLNVCLNESRCQAFAKAFREGTTPFADSDPILLYEYNNHYWTVEGKHRVCFAKRSGVEALEAVVYLLKEDTMSVLPPVGKPGHFRFRASYPQPFRRVSAEEINGEMAFLWVDHPDLFWDTFSGWVWLDVSQNTNGQWTEILPGFRYRVSTNMNQKGRICFWLKKLVTVHSEVEITPEHPKTKIWLLKAPAEYAFGLRPYTDGCLSTVYRSGLWRRHHLRQLGGMRAVLFPESKKHRF